MDGMDGIEGMEMPDVARIGQPEEEFTVGPLHWAVGLVLIFGAWWLWSRFSGSGGNETEQVTEARPAAEDLRRKRLERLGSTNVDRTKSAPAPTWETDINTQSDGVSAAADKPEASVEQAAETPDAAEGLRRRGAGAAKSSESLPQVSKDPAANVELDSHKTVEAAEPAKISEQKKSATELAKNASDMPAAESTPTAAPAKAVAKKAVAGPFSVTARGLVRGTTMVQTILGCTEDSVVEALHERIRVAFEVGGEVPLRLFFTGKELKLSGRQTLGDLGIISGSTIQIMVVAAKPSPAQAAPSMAPAAVAAAKATPETKPVVGESSEPRNWAQDAGSIADSGSSFCVRALGTAPGRSQESLSIEGLTEASTVRQLEGKIGLTFGVDGDVRLRLIFMGKELKDPDALLTDVGVKSGVTLQANFAASVGKPAAPANFPTGSSVSAVTPMESTMQMPGTPAATPASTPEPVTREEAWRALAELQAQLARATDPAEDQQAQNASAMLKQMLITATHGNNPALLQFAQAQLPDLRKIMSCESTREYLKHILVPNAPIPESGDASSSSGPTPAANGPVGDADSA